MCYQIKDLLKNLKKEKNMLGINTLSVDEKFKNLEKTIESILETISKEKLDSDSKNVVLEKLLSLSPKRTGIFLEFFNKKKNNLLDSTNQFHDALLDNNDRVEIKTSRVLMTEKKMNANNLYEQLVYENRIFTPFSKIFTGDYVCNIQQVKTDHFEQLNYCLFFSDIILEFKVSKDEVKSMGLKNSLQEFEKRIDNSKIDKEQINELLKCFAEDKYFKLDQIVNRLKDMSEKDKSIKDFLKENLLLLEVYNKGKLGYSDKQHKGNIGEGQFHITKDNIMYHLLNNFVRAYSYYDFINVLKESVLNEKRTNKSKI